MFSFTGSRASFLGDTNFYGKQVGFVLTRISWSIVNPTIAYSFVPPLKSYTDVVCLDEPDAEDYSSLSNVCLVYLLIDDGYIHSVLFILQHISACK